MNKDIWMTFVKSTSLGIVCGCRAVAEISGRMNIISCKRFGSFFWGYPLVIKCALGISHIFRGEKTCRNIHGNHFALYSWDMFDFRQATFP